MAILLVSYDLKKPGRNYEPVYEYLKRFTWCKGLESVWLLDTQLNPQTVREGLGALVDANDVVFVVRIARDWSSFGFYCANWLNSAERNW
jgi:hypothetical protein